MCHACLCVIEANGTNFDATLQGTRKNDVYICRPTGKYGDDYDKCRIWHGDERRILYIHTRRQCDTLWNLIMWPSGCISSLGVRTYVCVYVSFPGKVKKHVVVAASSNVLSMLRAHFDVVRFFLTSLSLSPLFHSTPNKCCSWRIFELDSF